MAETNRKAAAISSVGRLMSWIARIRAATLSPRQMAKDTLETMFMVVKSPKSGTPTNRKSSQLLADRLGFAHKAPVSAAAQ
jgi:hypothetical protein